MKKSEEDYIKTILEIKIQHQDPFVKVSDIAQTFGYSEQSVYEMIRKLQDMAYVVYTPYKGVELTKEGEAEAIRLVRAHRIWEVFLTESLGFSWQDVHEEAEQLEHASSEAMLERMYEYLGRPTHCQHGNPIPDFQGRYHVDPLPSLWTAAAGQEFVLKRVIDDYELLEYLQRLEMYLGASLEVLQVDSFQEHVEVLHREQRLVIGKKIALMLFGTLT